MEEEQGRLHNIQKKYSNLISLHRALPLEIWSKIFLATLSDSVDSNALNASGPIWRLSHVCQSWRNIALSLRSFWSTLEIRIPKAAQHERDVQRLETIIQRSRQGSLDISLFEDISEGRAASDPLILQRTLDVIFAESYRWRKALLSCAQGGWNTIYAPLHNRLPHLESLALRFTPFEEEQSVSVFEYCPRLTKVRLLGQSPLVAKFPWDQITELDLADIEFEGECMRLISQCPSLQTLTMPLMHSQEDEDESAYTSITCLNMNKLYVTSASVVDALTLPRLQQALLGAQPATTQHNILVSLKQLLIRSNCLGALTGLRLSHVRLAVSGEHSLLSILPQMRSLTCLDLSMAVSMEDEATVSDQEQIVALVKSLKVVPTESVTFLPLLSSLDIRVFDHKDTQRLLYFGPVGSLASTLQTRWKGDDALGLERLTRCHFSVRTEDISLDEAILRDNVEDSIAVDSVFNEEERHVVNVLINEGMDLCISVRSLGGIVQFSQFGIYW
ncbi:hypothetical protein CPB85DRAFT_1562850 [Mucidula mucida]|nr:hypothetical protein CPB85DRAFT_1562850 [Mucidula mucida]